VWCVLIYSNDDPMAIFVMEAERTGNYGNDYDDTQQICSECGEYEPDYFYFNMENECIGCSHCIYKEYHI